MISRSTKSKLMYLSNICHHFAFIQHVFFFEAIGERQQAINQFINMKNDINHWHRSNICLCLHSMRTAGLRNWDILFPFQLVCAVMERKISKFNAALFKTVSIWTCCEIFFKATIWSSKTDFFFLLKKKQLRVVFISFLIACSNIC